MDFHCRDDRLGPAKLARTDHFPLPKNMQSDNALALGCSQASADAIAGFHLAGDDHRRLLYVRSENSFGAYPRHASCAALRSSPLLAQDISERVVFTASQLRELQHHALIFKHLTSGVNVPPELVFPIRASLVAGFAPAAHPYLASLGWGGSYPLLYGGSSTDTEPGRCRRTDGKKWRCSRDVVPDHKYCERHMHRGKHRAKKPALAAAAATTAPPAAGSTPPPNPNPNNAHSTSSAAPSSACAPTPAMLVSPTSSSLTSFQPLSMHQAAAASLQQQQHAGLLGMQARRLTAKEMGYLDAKYQHMSHGAGQETFFSVDGSCGQASAENSAAVSGLSVMSSSSHAGVAANNPLVGQPACGIQSKEAFIGGRDRFHCQPLRHFFDDWPVRARESSAASSQLANSISANGAWSYEDTRASSSSTTQLSISIPSSKLMQAQASSSSSSPRGSNSSGVKLGLSPAALKLSMSMQGSMGEDDPLQLGSQLIDINEGDHFDQGARHEHEINCNMSSWIPIAWEPSPSQHVAGGPLAEVLQSSTNSPRSLGCKHSGLNLMSDGWDHHESTASPHHHQHHHQHQHQHTAAAGKPILSNNVVSSSPVGVLQINATLASSSDNSTANSPSHALNTNDADERAKSHA